MPDRHATIVSAITDALRDADDIRALFLGGSHGNATADAYSDIDFVMVAANGPCDDVAALWRDVVARTGEIVLWWDRNVRPALINAITDDWTRIDVVILKPDQTGAQAQDRLKPLFDHDGFHERLPKTAGQRHVDPARLRYQIENFIRVLGLLHLGIGREEYLNGVLGLFHLRNLLVDLLIAETDAPNRGGVLHLNRLITDEQKQLLYALPPPVPERDALIAAHLAYARAYLPRARRMALAHRVEWPERFEAATWRMLAEELSIEPPSAQT